MIENHLSRLFKEVISKKELKGALVAKTLSLSHLLFVNDVLLFCFGGESDLRKSLELLDLLCADTRMEVNYNKSACYCHNIDRALSTVVNNFFPFDKVDLVVGFKYLGYFLKPTKYTK